MRKHVRDKSWACFYVSIYWDLGAEKILIEEFDQIFKERLVFSSEKIKQSPSLDDVT